MLKLILLVLSMASCLTTLSASAQDDIIGYVKTVEGDANIIVADKTIKAQPGAPVYLGCVLSTGEGATMGVTFKDNTVMSFGPSTKVTVDEYLYVPAQGDLKLVASIAKGTLHYISGVIAKLKPEAVAVKTPTGIIGVRGTHFLVKVEAE